MMDTAIQIICEYPVYIFAFWVKMSQVCIIQILEFWHIRYLRSLLIKQNNLGTLVGILASSPQVKYWFYVFSAAKNL